MLVAVFVMLSAIIGSREHGQMYGKSMVVGLELRAQKTSKLLFPKIRGNGIRNYCPQDVIIVNEN